MKKYITAAIIYFLIIPIKDNMNAEYIKAPGIALINTDGKFVKLSQLLQKSHCIIAFWSTYCKPCRRELPELCKIEEKYAQTKNVMLVLISVDEREKKDEVISKLKELGIDRVSLLDIYQVAAKNYKIARDVRTKQGIKTRVDLPSVFLVDKRKRVVFKSQGFNPKNLIKLEKAIKQLP